MLVQPKLFISYAREKKAIANFFRNELTAMGYQVFLDEASINVGDRFPEKIEQSLKNCDGVILLVSAASIVSEWCRYEYYYAFFHNKTIIPILTENIAYNKDNPLHYFQKDINYTSLENEEEPEMLRVIDKIKSKLTATKKSRLRKIIHLLLTVIFIIAAAFAVFMYGVKAVNSYTHRQERNELLVKIQRSGAMFSANELETIAGKFKNDAGLMGQLFILETDDQNTMYARLNARVVMGFISPDSKFSEKIILDSLTWRNTRVSNNLLSNKIFTKGRIEKVSFSNTSLSAISFLQTTLSDLQFTACSFNTVRFSKNDASVIDFTACKFNGCYIDVSNFLNVHFITIPNNDPSIIDVSKSTYFDHCIFEANFEPITTNTIDFTRIKAVTFSNINFSNCRFNGVIDTSWFTGCGFYNCMFADPDVSNVLKKHNHVE